MASSLFVYDDDNSRGQLSGMMMSDLDVEESICQSCPRSSSIFLNVGTDSIPSLTSNGCLYGWIEPIYLSPSPSLSCLWLRNCGFKFRENITVLKMYFIWNNYYCAMFWHCKSGYPLIINIYAILYYFKIKHYYQQKLHKTATLTR